MSRHKGCVTDPLTRQWWRDYCALIANGKIGGVSFVEYVGARAYAEQGAPTGRGPTSMASCGHLHEWGAPCGAYPVT